MSKKVLAFGLMFVLLLSAVSLAVFADDSYVNPVDPPQNDIINGSFWNNGYYWSYITLSDLEAGLPYEGLTPDWDDPTNNSSSSLRGFFYTLIFDLSSLRTWLNDTWWNSNTAGVYIRFDAYQRLVSSGAMYNVRVTLNSSGVHVDRLTLSGDLYGSMNDWSWQDIDFLTIQNNSHCFLFIPCTFCSIDSIQHNPDGTYGRSLLISQSEVCIWSNAQHSADVVEIEASYNRGVTDGGNTIGGFNSLILAVFQAPVNVIQSILSFELFGVNLFYLFCGLLTLALFVFIIKKLI